MNELEWFRQGQERRKSRAGRTPDAPPLREGWDSSETVLSEEKELEKKEAHAKAWAAFEDALPIEVSRASVWIVDDYGNRLSKLQLDHLPENTTQEDIIQRKEAEEEKMASYFGE